MRLQGDLRMLSNPGWVLWNINGEGVQVTKYRVPTRTSRSSASVRRLGLRLQLLINSGEGRTSNPSIGDTTVRVEQVAKD